MLTALPKNLFIPFLIFLLVSMVPLAHASATGSLVEPTQLKKWIDIGYRTEQGERVVIINVVPNPADRLSWFAGDAEKLKQSAAARFGDRSPQFSLRSSLKRVNWGIFQARSILLPMPAAKWPTGAMGRW